MVFYKQFSRSTYNQKLGCWHTIAIDHNGEQKYCVKLGKIDKVQVDAANRYYVLILGQVVDDEGNLGGNHANIGLVGAFVVEVRNSQAKTIASNSKMLMGSWGKAPKSWEFVRLGAEYWAWQSEDGDCHHGYCSNNIILLGSYKNGIRDLTGGEIGGWTNDNQESVSVEMAIDSSQSRAQVSTSAELRMLNSDVEIQSSNI